MEWISSPVSEEISGEQFFFASDEHPKHNYSAFVFVTDKMYALGIANAYSLSSEVLLRPQ